MIDISIINQYPFVFVGLVGLLGLCVGSFLNTVIYRLPIMLNHGWQEHRSFNLAIPGSRCAFCHHPISAFQNIPVLSYLFLKGQCAHCKKKIPIHYPLVEVISASLAVYLAFHFGSGGALFFALVLSWGLVCLTVIDIQCQLLPDSLTLLLLWIGLLANILCIFTNSHDAILGVMLGYSSLWLIAYFFYCATDKVGMGHGDFKLSAMLGAWFGWKMVPFIILLAAGLGLIGGILLMLFKGYKRDTPMSFGPYLAFAGWVVLIGGPSLRNYLLC